MLGDKYLVLGTWWSVLGAQCSVLGARSIAFLPLWPLSHKEMASCLCLQRADMSFVSFTSQMTLG